MNPLNSVIIEGNLTRDPELKTLNHGTSLCSMSIASSRTYKKNDQKEEEVSFFDLEAWGKLAETCHQYLVKGRGVRVVGRLKQNRWESSEGSHRSKVIVVVENIEFKPNIKSQTNEEAVGVY